MNSPQHASAGFFAIVAVMLATGVVVMLLLGAVGAPRPVRILVGWVCGAIAGLITAGLISYPLPF
jgi:uncharacterized membrane protein YccC